MLGDHWSITAEGAQHFGVNHGNGAKPMEVVACSTPIGDHADGATYLTLKVPGGKHWASVMDTQASHPGSYIVLKVLEIESVSLTHARFCAIQVQEFNLRPEFITEHAIAWIGSKK